MVSTYRNVKSCQNRISSFRRARSGLQTPVLATPSNRFLQLIPPENIRQLPPSLLQVNKTEVLGEGSFGTCFQGYIQGNPVCLKHLKESKKEHIIREASILSSLSHHAILCFLHGIQVEEEPYYLVTNIYLINGYSITIYDFICLTSPNTSSKKDIVQTLNSELLAIDWCIIMSDIAEGLKYIHSKHIIHRDLKSNNVVLHKQHTTLKPVLIDFGKGLQTPTSMKYNLTEIEKQQYREQHKHIAPDLIDGISVPSSSSDMFSFGRIFKSIICYLKFDQQSFHALTLTMVKKCLKYSASEHLTAAEAMERSRLGLQLAI